MFKKNIILKFLLVAIIFIFANSASATVYPVYDYAKAVGGTGADVGNWITVDSSGNSYTTGYFNGTVDFDPGSSTSELTSAGGNDIFIEKLDSNGDFVWVKQIGGTGGDSGNHINIDTDGNIYVVGGFNGTVDFDPGAGTNNLTSAGSGDVYILKLDSSGNFISVKQVGGTGDDYATSVVFYSGNIFITGDFVGTVDFDPGAGTTNLTSSGSIDVFILKLNSSGNFVWAKGFGSAGGGSWADWVSKTVIDSNGNIYTSGSFGNNTTADFDPGAGTYNLTPVAGGDWGVDAYIQKLDVNGDFVWAKQFGGNSWDGGVGPVVDSSGSVYLTGQFYGTADFDPGAGTANLTSAGSNDTFIVKLDTDGNFVWVKQNGSTGSDDGTALAIDSSNNIYVGGGFVGTVDFDPGAGTSNLTSNGVRDIFVNKLDSSGNFVWAKALGGSGDDRPNSIAINSTNGHIYTTGYFNSTADFDPDSGTANLTSAGGNDIFISRLIPDIVAPTFTSVSSSNITNTGVTITFSTNEVSSSIVDYGLTTGYGTTTTETDTSTMVTSHTVNLSNLTECTTYHYRVKSNDPSANLGTGSDSTFTTPGCSAVSVVLLQQMSDAMRQQESTVVLPPPTTPINTIVFCEGNAIFNPNTGERCTSQTNTISKFIFLKTLKYKDNNTDVKELQKFLNSNGFTISTTGPGSIGNETNYFGLATRNALIKYQIANNIKPAIGYFGILTRNKINNSN